MDKKMHTTYGHVVHMLYVQVVYTCHVYKDISDNTEQAHNKYIDRTYLFKRYMNIEPTGHYLSFTGKQNLPYSVLVGFISPRNIVITTQCSGSGSSSVFIKSQKSNNSHQNNDSPRSIPHLFVRKHIISQIPDNEYFLHLLFCSHKYCLIRWISPTNW